METPTQINEKKIGAWNFIWDLYLWDIEFAASLLDQLCTWLSDPVVSKSAERLRAAIYDWLPVEKLTLPLARDSFAAKSVIDRPC